MMITKSLSLLSAATIITLSATSALAQDHSHHDHHDHSMHLGLSSEGHDHGSAIEPPSLMGTHMHKKGEWMVSYRYNFMRMEDMRDGTDDLSVSEVIALPNPNAPPGNFRVVPTEMNMHMHMFGAMYGVNDWLTVMGMAMYMQKDMDHITHNMAGARIGTFETESGGLGDLKGSAMIRLYDDQTHHLHVNAGLSLPTGSITEEDDVFTPMGTTMTLRLPYAMQNGSGTYDFHPGLTYTGQSGNWGWGAQYSAEIRLEDENDEGYALGDKHSLHIWNGYGWDNGLSLGARASFSTQDDIDGSDSNITAPVPTADPNNYGGEIINGGAFISYAPPHPEFQGHVLGFEAAIPLYQDLNGPQMEQDYSLTARWSFGF